MSLAVAGGSAVAVVPCCHRGLATSRALAERLGTGVTAPIAMDAARCALLRGEGYEVEAGTLPRNITPQNRVILGSPGGTAAAAAAADGPVVKC